MKVSVWVIRLRFFFSALFLLFFFFFYLKHAQPKGSQCLTRSWDASGLDLGRWWYRLFLHTAR